MIARRLPIKRGKPPQRKAWPKKRREGKRRRGDGHVYDEAWLREVRKLACCAPAGDSQCSGPVQSDHVGRRGLGQKSSDRDSVPLCDRHHQQRDGRAGSRGPFRGWSRARMRAWLDERIAETQTTVTANLAGVGGVEEAGRANIPRSQCGQTDRPVTAINADEGKNPGGGSSARDATDTHRPAGRIGSQLRVSPELDNEATPASQALDPVR